jgi:hypothetical protein
MDAGAQRIAGAAERASQTGSGWTDSGESGLASTKETANLFADQTAQGAHTAAARGGDAIEHGKSKTDQFADKAATISKNSRS